MAESLVPLEYLYPKLKRRLDKYGVWPDFLRLRARKQGIRHTGQTRPLDYDFVSRCFWHALKACEDDGAEPHMMFRIAVEQCDRALQVLGETLNYEAAEKLLPARPTPEEAAADLERYRQNQGRAKRQKAKSQASQAQPRQTAAAPPEPPPRPAYADSMPVSPQFRWKQALSALAKAGMGKDAPVGDCIQWVAENWSVDVTDIDPEGVPSAQAVSMLRWVQSSPSAQAAFFSNIWQKWAMREIESDARRRHADNEERLYDELDRFLAEPADVEELPDPEGAESERDLPPEDHPGGGSEPDAPARHEASVG